MKRPDTLDDTLAFFSHFGPAVNISAPGVSMASIFVGSRYAVGSGTSMAPPHVSGAAALYLANHPGASPADVLEAFLAAQERGPIPVDPDDLADGIVRGKLLVPTEMLGCTHGRDRAPAGIHVRFHGPWFRATDEALGASAAARLREDALPGRRAETLRLRRSVRLAARSGLRRQRGGTL